ncbi:MarR family winged helix-turn-helix transcriptional regulator [Mucilaginibacter lappiensis]|uniref:MarR family winged helix-turn-helix transcriptional regulator n=1 Tax=Mucilaginibacter lappiensis TaxID=354630 RepID=UPI003D221339
MKTKLKLDEQLCFPLYALSREITNLYRPLLEELNITYPQYLVLLVLWETNEQTVNQLGEKLRLDSGTLTPLLKRLEQKGIVNRSRSTKDERIVLISLTNLGASLKEKAECIPEKLVDSFGVSEDDLLHLKKIVNKILVK